MRRSLGASMLVVALLGGCVSQPAARPDPTPIIVYVTPVPSTGTPRPDPTPIIVYVTPAPTQTPAPTAKPTQRPTAQPIPTRMPEVGPLPSLTVIYVTPKPKPTLVAFTFTLPPSQSEDNWGPYFHLNGGAFTIHYVQTGEAYCRDPEGFLLPKGIIDNWPNPYRTYWYANLGCASGSKSTDVMGDPLRLAAGYYHMWFPGYYNTLTITITQP